MRTVEVAPRASTLIESMRDIGYSLETALADIIDNSVTAGARTIRIFAEPGREAAIAIVDDGAGMSEEVLLEAMRPGSKSPLEERGRSDLGRFGLGLKTASFSQGRRLTVVSRCDGQTCGVVWDLDRVAETDEWRVQIPDDPLSIPYADQLGDHGTLVLWEKLDRLVDDETADARFADFARRLDEAREHLELVFHRFLSPDPGQPKLRILLNQRPLEAFDPFHSRHPATTPNTTEPESIRVGDHCVSVQAFTLPHHSKVSPAEWERYGGRAGYVKNQGFYVYRERRLIIHGTWFGLARQTELTKLARIRIDMPNGLDAEWKIDVRKASAQPPYQVRERLRRIIDKIGATSSRVYKGRGATTVSQNRLPVWHRLQDKGEIRYRLNIKHPVFSDFGGRLPVDLVGEFMRLIELVAASLPMDALLADLGGEPEKVTGHEVSCETLESAVHVTIARLRSLGTGDSDIIEMLQHADPFRTNWERAEPTILAMIGDSR